MYIYEHDKEALKRLFQIRQSCINNFIGLRRSKRIAIERMQKKMSPLFQERALKMEKFKAEHSLISDWGAPSRRFAIRGRRSLETPIKEGEHVPENEANTLIKDASHIHVQVVNNQRRRRLLTEPVPGGRSIGDLWLACDKLVRRLIDLLQAREKSPVLPIDHTFTVIGFELLEGDWHAVIRVEEIPRYSNMGPYFIDYLDNYKGVRVYMSQRYARIGEKGVQHSKY